MSKPEVGGGGIEIELDGRRHVLIPSLEACIEISRASGGISGTVQRLQLLNFETICMVVGSGLQMNGKALNPRQRDDLVPGAVYRAGLTEIAPICINFCRAIANGGRLPDDDDKAEAEDEDEGEGDVPLG